MLHPVLEKSIYRSARGHYLTSHPLAPSPRARVRQRRLDRGEIQNDLDSYDGSRSHHENTHSAGALSADVPSAASVPRARRPRRRRDARIGRRARSRGVHVRRTREDAPGARSRAATRARGELRVGATFLATGMGRDVAPTVVAPYDAVPGVGPLLLPLVLSTRGATAARQGGAGTRGGARARRLRRRRAEHQPEVGRDRLRLGLLGGRRKRSGDDAGRGEDRSRGVASHACHLADGEADRRLHPRPRDLEPFSAP